MVAQYDASRVIEQLLRQHETGLKMYLVCRLGGPQRLAETYQRFRAALSSGSSSALKHAPSLPAYAYAVARRAALEGRSEPGGDLGSVPWVTTPDNAPVRYGETLDRLRVELPPNAAEAVELHFARGLGPGDVAYVMGVTPSVAAEHIASGARAAQAAAAGLEKEIPVERLARDVFQPQTEFDPRQVQRLHARPVRLSEGAVIGGRFEISSSPHTTGTSSVYIAADSSVPGQSVVLHLLHRPVPTTAARTGMTRKVQLLGSVVNASVGRILDYGWHADRLWYAMPWYEGHTLEQLVEQGSLTPDEAIEIFGPVTRALSTLHQHGVVHRNINEGKILILRLGAKGAYQTLPLLTGFNTWLLGEVSATDEPRTIAPEIAKRLSQGSPSGTAAASEDVFGLGLVMLRSLDSGVRKQPDEAWSAFLARRASTPIEVSGSAATAPFAPILQRALSLNPEARPGAAEVAKAIEKAKPKVAEKRSRRRLLVPLTVLAAGAALVLVTYFVRQSRLRLIHETLEAADASVLAEELEAERTRSKELEQRLDGSENHEP